MAGLLLGIAFAVLRERIDRRVHTSADVERLFGVPVLAEADASRGPSLERSVNVQHEMRALHHALQATDPRAAAVVLLIGSTDATADELAGVLASVSARSTLLRRDSDIDDPTSTLTTSSAPDLEVVDYQSLGIVAGGELRPQVASAWLGGMGESGDLVVLGLPTGDRALDLPALGHSIDVVVVVVELGVTRQPTISQLLGDLSRTNVRQIVAVTVRSPKEAAVRAGDNARPPSE